MRAKSRPQTFFIAVVATGSILLTACGSAEAAVEPAEAATESGSTYPLTIDNCGTTVTFDAAPERVLAVKSTSIEMMLALGLQDRLVGTAFSDGPLSDAWAERAQGVPIIDERVPGQEATLSLEPDLVYAGWESNVTAEGAGDRAVLAGLGVGTYVSPAACQKEGYQPDPLTFEHVFSDISEIGDIFDVAARADELVADLRARLDAADRRTGEVSALWYSSGSDTPFVGAGIGAPQMIMDAAGLKNIAADIPETWSSMSWEAVVDANPDVIVLVDSAWGSTEKKIGVLEANPATAQLDAVKARRYLVVPFPASEAGVRNVEAVESLITQLEEIDLP